MYNLFNVDSTQPKAYPLNIQLEYKIFEAVLTPDLLHGVLYLLPIFYQGKLFIRYICSGSYTGLLQQIITLLQKEYNVMDKDTYPWEVYTQKDIQMNSSKIGTPHHHPTTYNREVGSQNTTKSNKNSVFSLLNRCKPSLEESYSILFIHKMQAHPTNPTHRQVIPNIILPWGGTSPHMGAGTSPFFFGPRLISYASFTVPTTILHASNTLSSPTMPIHMPLQYSSTHTSTHASKTLPPPYRCPRMPALLFHVRFCTCLHSTCLHICI